MSGVKSSKRRYQVPAIPTTQDERTRKWMEAVASNLNLANSTGLDGVPTRAELIQAGIAGPAAGGGITYGPGSRNMTVPPKIEGLIARGAMDNIFLSWTAPAYANHALVEIWRSTVDDVGQAFQVGSTTANVYADNVGAAAVYRYWVRAVSREQVRGPYSDSVQGETGKDAAFMLSLLTGQIRESHLYQALNERINLIDLPDTGLVDRLVKEVFDRGHADELLSQSLAAEVTARANEVAAVRTDLSAEVFARTGGDVALGARITTEEQTRADGDAALATSITALTARVDDNQAAIVTEQTTRATQDDALAQQYTGLAARVTTAEGNITSTSAALTAEQTTRATADSAIASSVTDLQARVTTTESGIAANVAAIHDEQTVRADADDALATSITALTARVGAAESSIVTEQQTRADGDGALASQYAGLATRMGAAESAITTEQTTRATADTAIASSVTTLQARINDPVTGLAANTAAIQAEQQVRADADGALSIRLDTLVTRVGAAESAITVEQQTRADGDGALASQYNGLAARMTTAEGGIASNAAALTTEQQVRVNADSAIATDVSNLAARVTTAEGGISTNAAAIQTEQQTRATADTALSNSLQTLSAQTTQNHNTALAAIQAEQETRSATDQAISSSVTTLQSRLNNVNGEVGASLEQKMLTQATVNNGLLAQYTLKAQIDQNGRVYVAGIALAAEAVAGNPATTSMILQADRVAIGNPGVNEVYPFILDADGRIYLNMVTIADGSITDAKIGTLTADTITGGTIQAIGGIEVGSHLWAGFDDYANARSVPGLWLGMEGGVPRFHLNTGGVHPGYFRFDGSKIEMNLDQFSSGIGVFSYLSAKDMLIPTMAAQTLAENQVHLTKFYMTYHERQIVGYAHTSEIGPNPVPLGYDLFGPPKCGLRTGVVTDMLPYNEADATRYKRFYDKNIAFTAWNWTEADFGGGSPNYSQMEANEVMAPTGAPVFGSAASTQFAILEPTATYNSQGGIFSYCRLVAMTDELPIYTGSYNVTKTEAVKFYGYEYYEQNLSGSIFGGWRKTGMEFDATLTYSFNTSTVNAGNRVLMVARVDVADDQGKLNYVSGRRFYLGVMLTGSGGYWGYPAPPYTIPGNTSPRYIDWHDAYGNLVTRREWRFINWGCHLTLREDTHGKNPERAGFADNFLPAFDTTWRP